MNMKGFFNKVKRTFIPGYAAWEAAEWAAEQEENAAVEAAFLAAEAAAEAAQWAAWEAEEAAEAAESTKARDAWFESWVASQAAL